MISDEGGFISFTRACATNLKLLFFRRMRKKRNFRYENVKKSLRSMTHTSWFLSLT
jgi:hypothetical protein